MESGLVLLQTAMPILAVKKLGASWLMLGTLGWVAQAVRLPICFTSGHLSERVGRATLIVPSACLCAAACALLGVANSLAQVMVLYTICLASIGAFYPALQALIGDVSERGQLRKNLGMFNVGWCVGGAVMALAAPELVRIGLSTVFYAGAFGCVLAAALVLTWKRPNTAQAAPADENSLDQPAEDCGPLLLIARMGHFTGFFGFAVIRILFPKLGLSALDWSAVTVVRVVNTLLVGLAVGILLTNVSAWWRGRIWPQVVAQLLMLVCAGSVPFAHSPVLIGTAFFVFGMAQSVTYTAALYHGLSARKNRGRSTGIHEGLVAAGSILGCLLGGLVAQQVSALAPYFLLSGIAGVAMIATLVLAILSKKTAAAVS